MTDINPRQAVRTVIATGDYKSSDPTPVTLKKGGADGLEITVAPSAQTGAGNTVTVTLTDADTSASLGSFTVTAAESATYRIQLARAVRRVTVTPVGSGTRTTLNYPVTARWLGLAYGPGVYFDGTKYASSEAPDTA